MVYKILALAIMAAKLCYSGWLNYLQMKSTGNKIPDNVADIYDAEAYKKWKSYDNEKNKLNMIYGLVSDGIYFLMMLFDVYAIFSGCFPGVNVFLAAILVMLLDNVVSGVISMPMEYYATFSIEERYGFNKTTKKTFVADQIKSFLISFLLMSGLMSLFILLHQKLGGWILLAFTGVLCVFLLVMFVLTPVLQKIYNKFTVLPEGELRSKLLKLLADNGCEVKEIKVVDGSKRSTKANAYFTGVGKTKTIVLYDTLMELMTEEEIIAVFAHEMGHNKHKDMLKGYVTTILNIVVLVAAAYVLVSKPALYADFGYSGLNYGFAFILLGVVLSVLNPIIGFLNAFLSCKHEYAADRFAVEQGYGEALVSALKKLARSNMVNLCPNPIVVKLTYDHPPMSERLAAITAATEAQKNK